MVEKVLLAGYKKETCAVILTDLPQKISLYSHDLFIAKLHGYRFD